LRHFEYVNVPIGEQISTPQSSVEYSNLDYLLSVARRRRLSLIFGLITGLIIGTAYFILAKPTFTATVSIFLDKLSQDNARKASDTSGSSADSAEVDSQVEVIRSWQIAKAFIESLSPNQRKQLASELKPTQYMPVWLSRLVMTTESSTGNEIDLDRILRSLSVSRVERTYVLAISFSATTAILAADLANEFVDAYQNVLREGRLAAQQRKRDWIQQRVVETRSALLNADRELQAFRLSPEVGESDAAKRELQLKTDNYEKLYQSLLQQKQQAAEDESFPQGEFHVITPAHPTAARRSPKLSFVLAMSLLAGLGGGFVFAALREATDQSLRTSGQVEEVLGTRFLGWLPFIRRRRSGGRVKNSVRSQAWADKLPNVMRCSTDYPHSRFAETLRAIRAAVSCPPAGDGPKVIGVVSTLPGEGKSTLSVNLGRLLAREGARLLVIDGDLRNRGLSRILAPLAQSGLFEALCDSHREPRLADLLSVDTTTGMCFLPIADTLGPELYAINQLVVKFDALLTEAKKQFDIIIVDLPPLAAVADARSLSALLDCFVLVVEWGQTNKGAVRKFLNSERGIRDRLLGVVLNKANLSNLKLYEQRNDPQHEPYRRYFNDDRS
jgi:capsular exopolysaccharide synthesis family protein